LVAAFPDHAICFRSLNEWANRAMIKELAATGYKLAAYRQIYVFDLLSETYWVHGNVKKDHRLLHRTTYRVVGNDELEEEDFPRIPAVVRRPGEKHSKDRSWVRTQARQSVLAIVG